jgi:branched-chain amino acid transport system substrate-binding protein
MRKSWTVMVISILVLLSAVILSYVGGAEARTIKLGIIAPLTGPGAAAGTGLRNSFDLAIKEANKSGKFPYKIEMVALDDASDPAVAFSAAMKLLSDKQVVAATGHWNSGCALATIHGFHANKIPFIVCAAISPRITEYNYPEVTRNCPTLSQETVPFAKWLIQDMGYKNFSAMVDTTEYGQQTLKDWKAISAQNGAKTISEDSFPVGTTDFRPILTKIAGLSPDAIFFGSPVTEGALTRSQMVQLGMNNILFSAASSLADEKFNEVAGPAAEGTVITRPGFDLEDLPKGIEWSKAYQSQGYKEPAGAYGLYAYEAAQIILEGLKQVGPDDKVGLAKAIRDIKYQGIIGTTSFDKNGQTELSVVSILVSQDGKWVKWQKSKYATGERKIPAPKK